MVKSIEDYKDIIAVKYTGELWNNIDWYAENAYMANLGIDAKEIYLNEAWEEFNNYTNSLYYEIGWIDGNAGEELNNPISNED